MRAIIACAVRCTRMRRFWEDCRQLFPNRYVRVARDPGAILPSTRVYIRSKCLLMLSWVFLSARYFNPSTT